MKHTAKRFFLLGVGIAVAGYAMKHAKKIKHAVNGLVKKNFLSKKEGEKLAVELIAQAQKAKESMGMKSHKKKAHVNKAKKSKK